MTNEHIDVETLSAFADGELNAAVALRVERHVAECDTCRTALARVRALVSSAAALPREVAPPADAWAGIRSRVPSAESRVPRRWWHNGWLAAAAAVILVAGSVVLTRAAGTRAPGAVTSADRRTAAVPASVATVDRRYEPTLSDLRDLLESQRARMAPSTARTLERSIAAIDAAIADARGALAADPSSDALARMLGLYYQQKIDFLKRATTIASSL